MKKHINFSSIINFGIFLVLALVTTSVSAQKFFTREGNIEFKSETIVFAIMELSEDT